MRVTKDYKTVLWMADLPEHPALSAAHRLSEPEEGQPLLVIDRIPAPDAPAVPEELVPWMQGPAGNPEAEPLLRESIPNAGAKEDDGSDARLQLADDPNLVETHDQWRARWRAWAEQELADRPARELYTALFAIYVDVTSHTEDVELVLGTGLLAWAPQDHPLVSRHLFTCAAGIEFDDVTGTISIVTLPALETLSLETDMLEPSMLPNPGHVNDIRVRAREFASHPLHRSDAGELATRIVNVMDAEGEYADSDAAPSPSAHPRSALAPAIIVRKRSALGLVEVFHAIAAEIAETGEVPSGLLPLVDPDHQPPACPDPTDGALVAVDGDDDLFLPLPLNNVQLDVIRRVDRHAQTLVQGPPGTGKTHTAAALLTHLLAQGKRVLVTAHTDRALKEVRSKLPESIKPLAVAVVGSDRSDMADLKVAVERISGRSSDHDDRQAQNQIAACLDNIDTLRRRRAEVRGQLLAARATEVADHEHAGYTGTLARIAQAYQTSAPAHEWIAELSEYHPDVPSPLDFDQSSRWLALLRDEQLAADESEAVQRLADPDQVPSPQKFADLIDAEARGEACAAEHSGLAEHKAYQTVAEMPAQARERLQARTREIARKVGELERSDETWLNSALRDIRGGRGATWNARADTVRELIASASPAITSVGASTEVTVAAGADLGALAALAAQLLAHVTASGPVKTNPDGSAKIGAFSQKAIKAAKPLFDAVRVNRQTPTTSEHLAAFLAHADGQRQLDLLDRAWPASVTIPIEDTLRERLQWHQTELEQLDRLLALGRELTEEERLLAEAGLPRPDWNDITSVMTYAHLVDAAAAQDAAAAAAQPLETMAAATAAMCTWSDAATTTHRLHAAVLDRDRDTYAAEHARLLRLHSVRELSAERDRLTATVRHAAPDLAHAVTANPGDPIWDARISNMPAAWDWARTGVWILAQDSTDTNVLQAQIGHLEVRLRREVEVLAATRAWNHAVSPTRLTGQSRADLTQYAQLVKSLGKGTGKYANAKRAEIRGAMDRCRPAVPVWILPIYRIAEQLRVQQDMFDVVIVDEASQAGLEATFLQYLAPKIVVIGDDKQVSPTAVGVDQQRLRDLASQYLFDDRYIASWQNPQRSLFDEANMRFGSKLTLVEHRRCVPEIIGFSNRVAYEPDNIRLIPVRQYGADRLEPIKAVHVADGYERGSSGNKTNPAEVDAIVDQIGKCLTDPRYDGLTFGVISLSGGKQARTIEAALLETVPAEEWSARGLRCGDAADFQGSERDVVFLSMVAAPEDGRRLGTLTHEMYTQRYNVAVSRAKDQLWLFHSVTLDQVPNPQDMRHHLLDYCYGIIGRARDRQASGSEPVPEDIQMEPFDSLFEQRVFNRLVDRGFTVVPQFPAMGYNLDLVVVGAKGRLAIECDGDAWHGPDAYEADLGRQRDLERCGWQFFRIRESAWYVDQHAVLARLWATLEDLDIRPSGWLDEELADSTDPVEIESDDAEPEDIEFADAKSGGRDEVYLTDEELFPETYPLPGGTPEREDVSVSSQVVWRPEDNEIRDPNGNVVKEAGATQMRQPPKGDEASTHVGTPDSLPSVSERLLSRPPAGEADNDAVSLADFEVELLHTARPDLEPESVRATGPSSLSVSDGTMDALPPYVQYEGFTPEALSAPRSAVVEGLRAIVEAEGPVVGFRLHQRYVLSSGGHRVGKQIARALNAGLSEALRQGILVSDNPLNASGLKPRTYRLPESAAVLVRRLGPRTLEQVPPLELAHVVHQTAAVTGWDSTEVLFRDVLHRLGRDRLSGPAAATLATVLDLARALGAAAE
ncbi:AAA domain-containing protein [Terrabacter sp. 2RAF25]|uniref:AAA domain-containing protein n=1 Tax=Terrabacter sp. 2RAF25 TaxID=3232998 RepID=UPI003F946258